MRQLWCNKLRITIAGQNGPMERKAERDGVAAAMEVEK